MPQTITNEENKEIKTMTNTNWEEKFEKYYAYVQGIGKGVIQMKALKDFISTTIKEEKTKLIEELIGETPREFQSLPINKRPKIECNHCWVLWNNFRSEVLTLLENKKKVIS